ncbi:MAG TPA: hypothetical protein VN730_09615 [Steroidobacteraceae bacterium]|nr:hypothetical protein [Steroidobacteraceae bacterium]
MTAETRSVIRRLAAKILGNYRAPAPSHSRELLLSLEAARRDASPGGEWEALAQEIIAALRDNGTRCFLRLPPIARTVHPPMRSLGGRYWAYLLDSARFSPAIQMGLTESPVGQPLPSPHYPLTSPLLMQHGYHLVRLLESTDFDLARIELVLEFGGGYGSFFRLLRNLGYGNRHIICDLPAMCALQRFYLRNVFPTGPQADAPPNLEWVSSATTGALGTQIGAASPSLFVATWSLSEVPQAVRDEVAAVLPSFDYILCAYQRSFGGYDNARYFASLERSLPQFKWKHTECPVYRNNFYLIGRRTD